MSMMHKKGAFLLRNVVGTAGENKEYDLTLINGHLMAVQSTKTGKTFVLGWQDIIEQAIAAGVNEEDAA